MFSRTSRLRIHEACSQEPLRDGKAILSTFPHGATKRELCDVIYTLDSDVKDLGQGCQIMIRQSYNG